MAFYLKHNKIIKILLIVFAVAALMRFYKLPDYPVSLSMDEVSIGYNAYSILKTGRDEWGELLPLAFKSVGDYKPPVNIYLTVPSVAVFGLTEFGVRFPSALIGSLTAVVFVLFLKEFGFGDKSSFLGGLWLALLPWHVHFSRASFEAITALFFLVLGIYFLLLSIRTKKYLHLGIAISSLSLSVWAYHAERFFVPFLSLALLYFFRKKLWIFAKDRKKLSLVLLVFLFFAVPFLILTFFTPAIRERAVSTSILRDRGLVLGLHDGKYGGILERIFDNDIYLIWRHFLGKYLGYYDLRFWFWKGMGFTPPGYLDIGLFYLANLPIMLVGIYKIFTGRNVKMRNLIIFWFFAGPLAASLATNEQHTLRALVWVPFFGLAMASGYEWFLKKFKKRIFQLAIIYSALIIVNVGYFSDLYLTQFPKFFSEFWQYGHKQIATFTCENQEKYQEIVISDTFGSEGPLNTGTPYLYVLFYCKQDPQAFLSNKRRIPGVSFRRVNWLGDKLSQPGTLLIGSPWDLPIDQIPEEQVVKQVNFLNGKSGFLFVEI